MQCTPSTPKSMAISHRFVQCHRWNMRQWKKGHRIDCARLDPNVFIVVDPSGHSGKSLESIYLRSSIRAPTASRIGMNTILSPSYLRRSKAQHSAPPPPQRRHHKIWDYILKCLFLTPTYTFQKFPTISIQSLHTSKCSSNRAFFWSFVLHLWMLVPWQREKDQAMRVLVQSPPPPLRVCPQLGLSFFLKLTRTMIDILNNMNSEMWSAMVSWSRLAPWQL